MEHVEFFGHPHFQSQGVGPIDGRQGLLGFAILALHRRHVVDDLGFDGLSLGPHHDGVVDVLLRCGHGLLEILVEQVGVLSELGDLVRQIGVVELPGQLIELIQALPKFPQFGLGALVEFIPFVDDVVLLLDDRIERQTLNVAAALGDGQLLLFEMRHRVADLSEHGVAGNPQRAENDDNQSKPEREFGPNLDVLQHLHIPPKKETVPRPDPPVG